MATLPTATSRARGTIRGCLTWGVVLVVVGYALQTFLQTRLMTYLPIGAEIAVAAVLGLIRVAGPIVLAVGIVGIGVQLGLAAYGVRPALPGDERRD
jgi:hypothetical protein